MLKKDIILNIPNVYTANAFKSGNDLYVGAGSETEALVSLFHLDSGKISSLDFCPGGMMSFIPVPGRPGQMVSIMGLYPPFIGKDAGLYHHVLGEDGWETSKFLDLPFAHRCEFVPGTPVPMLIAATVSQHKDNSADWSRPGEIYLIDMRDTDPGQWQSRRVHDQLTRNHGMIRNMFEGREQLFVSGKEGIFSVGIDHEEKLQLDLVYDQEVSEMCFIDITGDGHEELVCIEPFHGTSLNFYRRNGNSWERFFQDELSFGHGLSAGYAGPDLGTLVVVGNRSENLSLVAYRYAGPGKGMKKTVLEEGVGPTQTQVFSHAGKGYILSANQKRNEVALYHGKIHD